MRRFLLGVALTLACSSSVVLAFGSYDNCNTTYDTATILRCYSCCDLLYLSDATNCQEWCDRTVLNDEGGGGGGPGH
jgi:hypothetical protein